MDPSEIGKWKSLLRSIEFFTPFGDDELEELLQQGEIKKYRLHEHIIEEDTASSNFYVILKGQASIVKEGVLKQKKNIASLTRGDCFGEMGVLLGASRSASVIAAVECFLFKIDGKKLNSLKIQTQAAIYRQLATFLAIKLRTISDTLVD